jgi:hypothetical protein
LVNLWADCSSVLNHWLGFARLNMGWCFLRPKLKGNVGVIKWIRWVSFLLSLDPVSIDWRPRSDWMDDRRLKWPHPHFFIGRWGDRIKSFDKKPGRNHGYGWRCH